MVVAAWCMTCVCESGYAKRERVGADERAMGDAVDVSIQA